MRVSARWLIGILAALCTLWAASALLLNTVSPLTYDSEVKRYVRTSGTVYHHRSEGWATTRIGRFDINAVPDITRIPGPKIALWGDSFVDAVQVNDPNKTAQQLARLLRDAHIDATPFAVGGGGLSVADYYFAMPDYEQAVPNIEAHIIVLGSIMDVMPDLDTLCHSRFLSDPPRLEESACTPSAMALRFTPWLYRLSLSFLYEMYDSATNRTVRLLPRTARTPSPSDTGPTLFAVTPTVEKAWDFLLTSLKTQARVPVVFLYVPEVPALIKGKFRPDPNRDTVRKFKDTCARHDIEFVNAGPLLTDYFHKTSTLTRGFFNMPPGEGHLNEAGHHIAAQALLAHIQQGRIHVAGKP